MYDVCKDKNKKKEKTFFILGEDLGKNKVGKLPKERNHKIFFMMILNQNWISWSWRATSRQYVLFRDDCVIYYLAMACGYHDIYYEYSSWILGCYASSYCSSHWNAMFHTCCSHGFLNHVNYTLPTISTTSFYFQLFNYLSTKNQLPLPTSTTSTNFQLRIN